MATNAHIPDLERFYESDLAFHRKIWEIAGNPYLTESLERVVIPLFAFSVTKNSRVHGTYEESAHAHGDIIDALASADAATVREMTRRALMRF